MKFRFTIFTGIAIVLSILSSCGPSQTQLASGKINISKALLSTGDTINSLLLLDSIPKLFPEATSEAQTAKEISKRIYGAKLTKQREKLTASTIIINSLIKDFNPEKGELDKYTNYIHNRQGTEINWSRSFIQVSLNERGDLTLSSNYYGEQWINHTSIRIVGPGIIAKTDSVPIDHLNNHHSEFNGAKWEKVRYQGVMADAVIETIAANYDKKLKALYLGKSYYVIWIEEQDKKAIKAAYDLSKALKVKNESEKIMLELEKKIR